MKKINLLAIVGPTAVGKTKISIELAKKYNGEIVSADSMQVYKYMNIGTAKPTENEMEGIPHHLIDFLDITEDFNVAEYVTLAKKEIKNISNKNKLPILCGGTGLYINSLIDNVEFSDNKSNLKIKRELLEMLNKCGKVALFKELEKVDPESAEKIHPNNTVRIIRALEFYKTNNMKISEQIKLSKLKQSPYNSIIIGLTYKDRDLLYDKINNRVDEMINNGLIEETENILSKNPSITALNAICYKELIPYINHECTKEVAIDKLKKTTRNYAKRQLTWFKKDKRINWVEVDNNNFNEVLEKCIKYVDFGKNI